MNSHIADFITSSMGKDTASQIQSIIQQSSATKSSVIGAIIGVVTLLVGATGVFAQFQKSLNLIWEVEADENKSGIWQLIKVRLFSFGLIVSIAFLLVVSLLVTTALSAFGDWLSARFSQGMVVIINILNFVFSIAFLSVLFALMLKIFPDAKIRWKDVWIGSLLTAVLFEIGKFALGLYFGKASPATAYGAAGSIILILLWVSYSSMIVFYGAEFTRAYTNVHSGKPEPTDTAKEKPPCNDEKVEPMREGKHEK